MLLITIRSIEFVREIESEIPLAAAAPPGKGKIRFYRDPMGLPDTSPVPKKDGMGMDYLPVYEGAGEDADKQPPPRGRPTHRVVSRSGDRASIAGRNP